MLQQFISKLNWRQILIHFIAFCFFIFAFTTLSFLYDTKLIDAVRNPNPQNASRYIFENGVFDSSKSPYFLWVGFSGLAGLLVAFIISLTITARQRWFRINAVVTLVITFLLYRGNLLGWSYLKNFFWFLGQRFENTTIEFLLNGLILIALGLLTFFGKKQNRFINYKPVKVCTESH